MKFSLVICTYMRPKALLTLLISVKEQIVFPDEILIIDGSTNNHSEIILKDIEINNLKYFCVSEKDRGLTKQRNFGVNKTYFDSEIICFLDDDTVLMPDYFLEIIKTFKSSDSIVGVGGVEVETVGWQKKIPNNKYSKYLYYEFDGYVYKEGIRNVARNIFRLQSDLPPAKMPKFSNGRTCGFPPSEKEYEVDLLIGMSFSFRKKIFDKKKFSSYFVGYGLYEDADFCIRALQFGKNIINTKAKLYHYHDQAGRPNKYNYGKMVVRNGWYVWRVKNPKPEFIHKFKWHSITILLTIIRFINTFTTNKKQEAFTEAIGRTAGWCSLLWNKPKIKN